MSTKFNEIKLDKGMYGEIGKNFTQVLESFDPSEEYRGTALEGLDAYQRQLKRFDIKVRGAGSDMVEKFFHTTESAVLFPEFVARSVRQGMEEENILPSITATVTKFDGMDYRSIYSVPTEDDKSLRRVEEGAAIPQTEVKVRENLVRLHKRGRMLVASYPRPVVALFREDQKFFLFRRSFLKAVFHVAETLLSHSFTVCVFLLLHLIAASSHIKSAVP